MDYDIYVRIALAEILDLPPSSEQCPSSVTFEVSHAHIYLINMQSVMSYFRTPATLGEHTMFDGR